ncbi:MAG: hypothetical protein ATN35_08380 [Epulopiscium sp. Nele67-Bin004]|nr:MAG: hypothetical protein ATN35_08380 [Epulopiscium sp. Nele67-Bin004]
MKRVDTEDGIIEFDAETGTVCKIDKTITEIEIPATIQGVQVQKIAKELFKQCLNLRYIGLPYSVTSIGEKAFLQCEALDQIYINPTNNHFQSSEKVLFSKSGKTLILFPNKRSQTYITPDGVTTIADRAFSYCTDLIRLEISPTISSIGENVFVGCSSLEQIIVNPTNEYFQSSYGVLFSKDGQIIIAYPNKAGEKYKIPDGIVCLGESSFTGCKDLREVYIPESLTTIGEGAFIGCKSLEKINVSPHNKHFKSIDGVLYTKDCKKLLVYPNAKGTKYTVPDTVEEIANKAFYKCCSLVKVVIPESVTKIGYKAFGECDSLRDVDMPDSIIDMGQEVF